MSLASILTVPAERQPDRPALKHDDAELEVQANIPNRVRLLLLLLMALLSSWSLAPAAQASGGRATVCFSVTGNHEREREIRVADVAVRALIRRTKSYEGPCAEYGGTGRLGTGEVQSYSQVKHGVPKSVGVIYKGRTIDDLPYDPINSGLWCHDRNGDGVTDNATECAGGRERMLPLGRRFTRKVDSPFTYVLLNWQPLGHIPPGVYDVPHFDVHFYMNPNEERLAIRPGPCPFLVNCDDYQLGKALPAAAYYPATFKDVDAVEPAMGNHLLDPNGPEFTGTPFDQTFLYGVWDREITFYEPMVSLEHYKKLRSGTLKNQCYEIPLPSAFAESGWLPTKYCLRYRRNRDEFTTSLENFVLRRASAATSGRIASVSVSDRYHRVRLAGVCVLR